MKLKPQPLYREPEPTRRKLAAELKALAQDRRFKPAERRELALMAERWAATLPKGKA
jgi:hypothetical protein